MQNKSSDENKSYVVWIYNFTQRLKKVPTLKLSVTLSNFSRFSKLLKCSKGYKICYKTRTAIPTSP